MLYLQPTQHVGEDFGDHGSAETPGVLHRAVARLQDRLRLKIALLEARWHGSTYIRSPCHQPPKPPSVLFSAPPVHRLWALPAAILLTWTKPLRTPCSARGLSLSDLSTPVQGFGQVWQIFNRNLSLTHACQQSTASLEHLLHMRRFWQTWLTSVETALIGKDEHLLQSHRTDLQPLLLIPPP